MEDIVAGNPDRTTRKSKPPPGWTLPLRPFGYLLVGLVWLAIWGFVFALGWGILIYGVVSGELTIAEITEPAMASVSHFLAMVFIVAPLVVVLLGPVILWWLPNVSWPLAALSFVYIGRSLRPSYRHEKLSFTAFGDQTTFGPPTISNVSLSLQPVRNTALTRFLMRFYVAGWEPSGIGFLAMLPAGIGWLLLFPAIAKDVSATTNIVCGVLGVGLVAWSFAWALRSMWTPAKDHRRAE
ncbi:hypothetical protein [Glycomyces buryatensis]|uniref:Uncharacterized protein n=1 Tax=Glycomyces buryatensis TaxID=2570927 RepID=A0A4S8QMV0_9ACTN|nr:hypothetical protein [Glycomyces buryatensis]THV42054.1 hypothetical protein FAB82_08395 [Glycomyces buryatensis]